MQNDNLMFRDLRVSAASKKYIAYGLLVLIIYGLWSWMNHALSIQTWQINSSDGSLAQEIENELQNMGELDFIDGTPSLLRKSLLKSVPDLLDVKVARKLPSTLYIEAIARRPIVLWKNDNALWLVDKTGAPYRRVQQGERFDLPLLRIEPSQLRGVTHLVLTLKQHDLNYYTHLSECRLLYDGSLKLYFNQRQTWLLPNGELAHRHLAKLIALLQHRRWRAGKWKVDARLEKRWFIRQAQYGGVI